MTTLFDPAPWWLVLVGWSVIVALWHTSVVALGLASWRVWRREADAGAQYIAASGTLVLATVLTVATPVALLAQRHTQRSAFRVAPGAVSARPVATDTGTPAAGPAGAVVSGMQRDSVAVAAATLVPWIGAAWILGSLIGLARFGGGWALAQWIRGRATAVGSPAIADAAAAASATWALPPAVLLASAHVDAPVVVGEPSPAVLLPIDLEHHVATDALLPLLAHELAHVRRRDYAANLVQSLSDALLWFSPGARWISTVVREVREYCCDDVVTQRCGASAYARALTALAGLGAAARAKPALNAVGPRLIVRIRRLLKEDVMSGSRGFRLTRIASALLLVGAVSPAVLALSAAGVHAARIDAQHVVESDPVMPVASVDFAGGTTWSMARASGASPIGGGGTLVPSESRMVPKVDIPIGFMPIQPGAALRLRDMQRTEAGLCGIAEIENLANVSITGVRFAAFAYAPAPLPRSNLFKASFATSELLAAEVSPHQIATVDVGLLTRAEARERLDTPYATIMCAVAEIRYANGARWEMPPATVFGPDRAEIPRALIGRLPVPGEALCRDESGHEYSLGAIAPVRLEPLTFTRCVDGAWSDYQLPGRQDPGR